MSFRGADGFGRYGALANLFLTSLCPIQWVGTENVNYMALVSPGASGSGKCISLGGGQASTTPVVLTALFNENLASWVVECGINLLNPAATSSDSTLVVTCIDAAESNAVQCTIAFNRLSGSVTAHDSAGHLLFTTNDLVNPNGWTHVAIALSSGSGTGALRIDIDGTTIYNLGNLTTQAGADAQWSGIQFTIPSSSGNLEGIAFISDVLLLDTVGAGGGYINMTAPVGPAYVYPLAPISNGPTIQWAPDNGLPNWEEVSSIPILGGTFPNTNHAEQDPVATSLDLYNFQSLTSELPLCLGIQTVGLYSNSGTLASVVEHNILTSSALSSIGTIDIPSTGSGTFVYGASAVSLIPNSGINWTSPAIDTTQAGPALLPNSGVVSNGAGIASASGTIYASPGPPPPSGTVPTQPWGLFGTGQQGITWEATIIETLASYPLGPIGMYGALNLFTTGWTGPTSSEEPVAGFFMNGADAVDDSQSGIHHMRGSMEAGVAVPLVPPYVESGSNTWTQTAENSVGTSLTISLSGYALATGTQGSDIIGNVQLIGNGVQNNYIAAKFVVGSSDVDHALVGWQITNVINDIVWSIYIYEANVSTGAAVKVQCAQFLIEAVTFTTDYGSGGGTLTIPIFPQLAGLAFPILRRFLFSNQVSTGASGAEARLGLWAHALWEWELEFSYLPDEQANGTTESDYRTLLGFLLSVQGNLLPFLFLDPDDNAVVANVLGTGDGSTRAFTIYRSYGETDGSGIEPVGYINTAVAFEVYVGGALQDPSTYVLNQATPLQQQVVFNSAPVAEAALTWSGGYYFYCRAGEEKQDFNKTMEKLWDTSKLVIRSLMQA